MIFRTRSNAQILQNESTKCIQTRRTHISLKLFGNSRKRHMWPRSRISQSLPGTPNRNPKAKNKETRAPLLTHPWRNHVLQTGKHVACRCKLRSARKLLLLNRSPENVDDRERDCRQMAHSLANLRSEPTQCFDAWFQAPHSLSLSLSLSRDNWPVRRWPITGHCRLHNHIHLLSSRNLQTFFSLWSKNLQDSLSFLPLSYHYQIYSDSSCSDYYCNLQLVFCQFSSDLQNTISFLPLPLSNFSWFFLCDY